jgi:hypothetical protein
VRPQGDVCARTNSKKARQPSAALVKPWEQQKPDENKAASFFMKRRSAPKFGFFNLRVLIGIFMMLAGGMLSQGCP